jgi:hypothetical protein
VEKIGIAASSSGVSMPYLPLSPSAKMRAGCVGAFVALSRPPTRAGALDDAAVMRGDGGIDQTAPQPPDPRQGTILVRAREPAVADDVGSPRALG